MTGFWMGLCTFLLVFVGFLLMFIVLLQRGRGGGLAGAFGGLGGQSAFGTKAGDVFTRITVVLAVVWVVLAGVTGFAMRSAAEGQYRGGAAADRRALENPEGEDAGTIVPPPKPGTDAVPGSGTTPEGGPDSEADAEGKSPIDDEGGKAAKKNESTGTKVEPKSVPEGDEAKKQGSGERTSPPADSGKKSPGTDRSDSEKKG